MLPLGPSSRNARGRKRTGHAATRGIASSGNGPARCHLSCSCAIRTARPAAPTVFAHINARGRWPWQYEHRNVDRTGRAEAIDENKDGERRKTWTEEIEVAGSQLLERIKDLIAEGQVRRLRIKAADGSLILESPLSVRAIAGGAVALAAPLLAVLGAFAALVARAKNEIVREEPKNTGS